MADLNAAICKRLHDELIAGMKQWVLNSVEGMVSIPLLHGRLEPQEEGAPRRIPLCQRHYLSVVSITDHRLALTRLLCGSFYFRGLRTTKCGSDLETPGHVFMQCRDLQTVAARETLRETLQREFGVTLRTADSAADAMRGMQKLIFDLKTVVPMARFIYQVVRAWRWFGRRLPTMVSELAPDTDEEADYWNFESAEEDWEWSGAEMEMEIDL
ncbi:hypothetical protein R3P38DRAFT_3325963 [Favolaschia claudopus]|uniref:Uncharacterized protein n=1 Tax=Favolaschia claudopus TaxID=2862362 RepID=A0AAW0ADE4_9AGAR